MGAIQKQLEGMVQSAMGGVIGLTAKNAVKAQTESAQATKELQASVEAQQQFERDLKEMELPLREQELQMGELNNEQAILNIKQEKNAKKLADTKQAIRNLTANKEAAEADLAEIDDAGPGYYQWTDPETGERLPMEVADTWYKQDRQRISQQIADFEKKIAEYDKALNKAQKKEQKLTKASENWNAEYMSHSLKYNKLQQEVSKQQRLRIREWIESRKNKGGNK